MQVQSYINCVGCCLDLKGTEGARPGDLVLGEEIDVVVLEKVAGCLVAKHVSDGTQRRAWSLVLPGGDRDRVEHLSLEEVVEVRLLLWLLLLLLLPPPVRLEAAMAAPLPCLYPIGGCSHGGFGCWPMASIMASRPLTMGLDGGAATTLVGAPPPPTPEDLTRLVCATRSKNLRSSSDSSARLCWICSGVSRFKSAVRLRKTCFPMQLLPTNFFEILMGSQLSNFERKVRRVVPSVSGSKPALNSWMRRLAYASSSGVHLPLRNGGPFFLLLDTLPELEDIRCCCCCTGGWDMDVGKRSGFAP
mmetsp:Transcript_26255/g.73293  ORF Transcript_26255/g.73293 Transcript_26255/m.73293 type:complete len:303 (-) Transcript_26255:237-1145(-)